MRWAGGHLARLRPARTPPLFVHSALPTSGLLAPQPAHASLFSKSAPAAGRSNRSQAHRLRVRGRAGDPVPCPTRRASAGTHLPQRLSPPGHPRSSPTSRRHQSAGKGEATSLLGHPPLSRPLRQFVSGDAAGRRHLLESLFIGVGSAATCGATSATLPSAKTLDHRGHVQDTGS